MIGSNSNPELQQSATPEAFVVELASTRKGLTEKAGQNVVYAFLNSQINEQRDTSPETSPSDDTDNTLATEARAKIVQLNLDRDDDVQKVAA